MNLGVRRVQQLVGRIQQLAARLVRLDRLFDVVADPNERVDLFALGVILFELLADRASVVGLLGLPV